jgi:hypothetical protein
MLVAMLVATYYKPQFPREEVDSGLLAGTFGAPVHAVRAHVDANG